MKPILRYQSGGNVQSLFIDYLPFLGISRSAGIPQQTRETSSDESKSSNKVGLKDLLGLIKDLDGLPADINVVENQIRSMYNNASLFSNGELSTSDLVSTYLSALRSIRMAKYNLKEYDDAKSIVTKNGGLNEVAINLHGKIYIQNLDSGDIAIVTPQEYSELLQSGGNYKVLTNSNLLYLRSHDPSFAFRNDILTTIQNGIGVDEVTQMISKIKDKIGSLTLQEEGYSKASADKIISGLQTLDKAKWNEQPLEYLYKQLVITESQVEEAQMALEYIWNTLPNNAKSRLRVVGAEYLASHDIDSNVETVTYKLIETLVGSGLTNKVKKSLDLIKNPGGSSSSDGSNSGIGDDAKGIEMTPAIGFILGRGYSREITMNPGTVYEFKLRGINGIITDHKGEALGEYSTLKEASNGAFAGLLDWNNVTYGGVKVETLNKVFLKNADIVSMDLPIDVAYFSETGIIRPDINLAYKMQQLDKAIQEHQIDKDNVELVNAFCESINLPKMYVGFDENGHPKLNTASYARFARIGALVDENSLLEDVDVADYANHEASDRTRENFQQYMKAVNKNYSLSNGSLFSTHDKLYEGAVFIPIREDIISATYGGNKYYKLPSENATSAAERWEDALVVSTYTPGKKLGELKNK